MRKSLDETENSKGQYLVEFMKENANLRNLRNAKAFWENINKFRSKKTLKNTISSSEWEKYFKVLYSLQLKCSLNVFGVLHPLLDVPFSIEELELSLKKCQNKKIPGQDMVCYEFLKNLPDNWKLYLLNLLNGIFDIETFP